MSAANFIESFAKRAGIWPNRWMSMEEYLEDTPPVSANEAQTVGILITHARAVKGKGGVTIAYRKMNAYKNCRMVEVAVAYCSPQDIFSKKIGTRKALDNFLTGKTIMIPARSVGDDDGIVAALRSIFWYTQNPEYRAINW